MPPPAYPNTPDRVWMKVEGLPENDCELLAMEATFIAFTLAPKLSAKGAATFEPIWGDGWYGIYFAAPYMWWQEIGINPFTMRNLAGKTIPMWIDDPTGEEARKNPKAKKRTTVDGRNQILIFRKAARIGERKNVRRNGQWVNVPRSYPGAPGRINRREPAGTYREEARVGGRIARGNVGVRWRHPGLPRKSFLRRGIIQAANKWNVPVTQVRDGFGRFV